MPLLRGVAFSDILCNTHQIMSILYHTPQDAHSETHIQKCPFCVAHSKRMPQPSYTDMTTDMFAQVPHRACLHQWQHTCTTSAARPGKRQAMRQQPVRSLLQLQRFTLRLQVRRAVRKAVLVH